MIAIITGSTRFILGVTKMSQADFSVKVKGQTKTAQQLNKRAGTTREIPERLKIHSLTLQVGTN